MAEDDAKGTPASALPSDLKFETALAELEQIVQNMESGHLSLEESISAYQRGSDLFRHCQQQLGEAEHKIRIFEKGELRDADLNLDGETSR
ncbi:exodeoxyribonuclease 7 small subunit [Betaproteobacteria bacterium]|nr:exodeoxyribonuclease 7 small subunit [Betaproteobacteria bacterium]